MYVFCLFFSELTVVKIYRGYELGNYNRNSNRVKPTVSILAGRAKQSET